MVEHIPAETNTPEHWKNALRGDVGEALALQICGEMYAEIRELRKRLTSSEAALAEADRRYRSHHGNLMYADVLYALAGDLESK